MRCMALSAALKEKGARTIFVIRANNICINYLLENQQEYYPIEFKPSLKQRDWHLDALKTIEIIKYLKVQINWLIVDHYALDSKWENLLTPYSMQIMVIDDLANRHHHCDLLLDQNIYDQQLEGYKKLITKKTSFIFGPKYALLRAEFKENRSFLKKYDNKINRIIISFGESDCVNQVITSLKACAILKRSDLKIDVISGRGCTQYKKIQHMCYEIKNTHLFRHVNNMSELMREADLAIGAGGSTTWERCCLGLPSVVLSIADNQVRISQMLDKLGVIKYLGSSKTTNDKQLHSALNDLMNNPDLLTAMRKKASKLVDGMGCERIVNLLYKTS